MLKEGLTCPHCHKKQTFFDALYMKDKKITQCKFCKKLSQVFLDGRIKQLRGVILAALIILTALFVWVRGSIAIMLSIIALSISFYFFLPLFLKLKPIISEETYLPPQEKLQTKDDESH